MDNELKKALEQITEGYSLSDKVYNNIVNELEGDKYMKKNINIKKLAFATAFTAVILTAGVTAASRFASYAEISSSINDRINHAPTADEVMAKIDYMPKYPDKMGSFTLETAQPTAASYSDDSKNEMASGKEMDFNYEDGDKKVTLCTSGSSAQFKITGDAVKEINGITIYYSKTLNKFVPPDYKPTPKEKQQAKEGKLNLAYGSSKIEIMYSEYMEWEDNGIRYGILSMDNELGKDTLAEMANDVINS